MPQPTVWMKKDDNVVQVSERQKAKYEERGYKECDPPVTRTPTVPSSSRQTIVLKPGQQILYKGNQQCICDEQQASALLAAGWSPQPGKAEPQTGSGPSSAENKGQSETDPSKAQGGLGAEESGKSEGQGEAAQTGSSNDGKERKQGESVDQAESKPETGRDHNAASKRK